MGAVTAGFRKPGNLIKTLGLSGSKMHVQKKKGNIQKEESLIGTAPGKNWGRHFELSISPLQVVYNLGRWHGICTFEIVHLTQR